MSDYQFALEDFKESYAQYRHLETERSRHLAFFFSALFAGVALIGSLAGARVDPVALLLTAVAISCVLQLVAMFVYAVVRKIAFARGRQLRVISTVRRTLLPEDHPVRGVWRSTSEEVRLQPFSVQRMAELTVLWLWVFLAVAGVSAPIIGIATAVVSASTAAGALLGSVAVCAVCLRIFTKARRSASTATS